MKKKKNNFSITIVRFVISRDTDAFVEIQQNLQSEEFRRYGNVVSVVKREV